MRREILLTPGQEEVFKKVSDALPHSELITLTSSRPLGKTTLLHALAREKKDVSVLGLTDLAKCRDRSPAPERLARLIHDALNAAANLIVIDDYERISEWGDSESPSHSSSIRRCDDYLQALLTIAELKGKRMVITYSDHGPASIAHRGFCFLVNPLSAEDCKHLMCAFLGEEYKGRFDFHEIQRMIPLDCFQIKHLCRKMIMRNEISQQNFLKIAEKYGAGNISDLFTSSVDFEDLVGLERAISELRIHVLHPLSMNQEPENILLVGAPGVGKSSIGKAICKTIGKERMFLIDGITSSPDSAYEQIKNYVGGSEGCPRSVIFMDDADILLDKDYDSSLLRLLLHTVSGFQDHAWSGSIILTASNAANEFPAALRRSGRFFTIHVSAPSERDRRLLLEREIVGRYRMLNGANLDPIVRATENFTGADLQAALRFTNRFLLAEHVDKEVPAITEVMLKAVDTVKENHRRRKQVGFV